MNARCTPDRAGGSFRTYWSAQLRWTRSSPRTGGVLHAWRKLYRFTFHLTSVPVLDAGGSKAGRRVLEQRQRHRFVPAVRDQHFAPPIVIAIKHVEHEPLMFPGHFPLELEHA